MKKLRVVFSIAIMIAACVAAVTAYTGVPFAPEELHDGYDEIETPDGCLVCHGEGGVKETPHPERASCKQCHIPGVGEESVDDVEASDDPNAGLPANRIHFAAPPMAPADIHPDFDEIETPDGCLACHGPDGVKPVSHPERASCKQCHIPFVTDEEQGETAASDSEGEKTIGGAPMAPAKMHPTFDKLEAPDGCLKCHGPGKKKATPHPERTACKQCHLAG